MFQSGQMTISHACFKIPGIPHQRHAGAEVEAICFHFKTLQDPWQSPSEACGEVETICFHFKTLQDPWHTPPEACGRGGSDLLPLQDTSRSQANPNRGTRAPRWKRSASTSRHVKILGTGRRGNNLLTLAYGGGKYRECSHFHLPQRQQLADSGQHRHKVWRMRTSPQAAEATIC